MPENIEIKARVRDRVALQADVEALFGAAAEVLHQEDTFFRVPTGRLKLRVLGDGRGELIHYHRPDGPGPKASDYIIAPTSDPAALRSILADVLEVIGVVRKERLLFLHGQTRIHLDRVAGLGDFLELEVVLRPEQPPEEGVRTARDIMQRLRIRETDLVEGAYLDLLLARGGG